MSYRSLQLKRKIENAFIQPFVWIGSLISMMRPAESFHRYYFFPFYHIGGAEKVHYQLLQATADKNSVVYFTRKSNSKAFLHEFRKTGAVIRDISAYTDNKFLFFLNLVCRGFISHKINRQQDQPLVFNGQCNFAYKISPWIRTGIPQVELIHALNSFSLIRLPFLKYYRKSVTVSQEIIDKHKLLYQDKNVPSRVWEKFSFISSKIQLPVAGLPRAAYDTEQLRILYVGRATPEKRPAVISSVARLMKADNAGLQFDFAGDVSEAIPETDKPFVKLHGDVSDDQVMDALYRNAHILVIPSSTESGPLVFMEAMARGLAIVSTPVGYVPFHVKNGISGYVTHELHPVDDVIAEIVGFISILLNNRTLLGTMGKYNTTYAFEHFNLEIFNQEYRNFLNDLKATA